MAAYYWIGGTTLDTGISGAAYDWNVPSNWRIPSGLVEPVPVIPTVCPGAGDVVFIGREYPDGNGNNNQYGSLMTPKAPLLWGGYKTIAGMTGTGTWIYGEAAGATLAMSGNGLTGALTNIVITIGKNDVPEGLTSSSYCFSKLGLDVDGTGRGGVYGSESLAYLLYNLLGLKQYSQQQWKTLIDQNKLSYSGLTGVFVKTNKVQINSLPIPTNSSAYMNSSVDINFVDNVNLSQTTASSPKYNTSGTVSVNGGQVILKNAKFSNLLLISKLKYYKTAEAGVRLTGSGSYLNLNSRDLWYNLHIGENNKVGQGYLELLGAEYYQNNDLQENYLSDNYVRSIYYPGSNHAYRPSKLISGTYNRSSVFSLFGITSAGSTGYVNSDPNTLSIRLDGIAPSPDFDFHVPPSPFIGLRGGVFISGITADGIEIFASNFTPTHYYSWNPITKIFECLNEYTYNEPCSYGQLEDYIPPVIFTGFVNNINYMKITNTRLIPIPPFITDSSSGSNYFDRTQSFNIGKLELNSAILETSMFGPNTVFWSEDDPNDYSYQQEPDWKFGIISNSATGVTLDGGIVFGDEFAQVRGAPGVRLLNYIVNKVTNKNNRTNSVLNEIVGNKIPTISGGSAQAL